MGPRTFMKKLGGLAALDFSMAVLTFALLPNYVFTEKCRLMMTILKQRTKNSARQTGMVKAKII
jgi:hypothetical protein